MLQQIPNGRLNVTLICFLLFFISGYSQTDTDLVRDFEQLELSNEKRLASLIAVDWIELDIGRDSLNTLLMKGIVLSETLEKEYEMYKLILHHTHLVGDYSDDRMKQLDDLITVSKENNWDSLEIAGTYWKGRGLGALNKYTMATQVLTDLINRDDKNNKKFSKIYAIAYEELGILKGGDGNLEGQLEMYKASLKINEENRDSAGICANLQNIGYSYFIVQDFEKFKVFTDRSLVIASAIKQQDYEVIANLNYANMFGFREMYDSCLVYALRAEKISKEIKRTIDEAHAADIIAACYLNLDQLPKALAYQLRAYNMIEDILNKNKSALNVGLVYIAMEDYENASKYYDIALTLAKQAGSNWDIPNVFNHIGYLCLKEKNYKKALLNFSKANDMLSLTQNGYLENETYRGLAMANQKLGNSEVSNSYIKKALGSQNNFTQLSELYQTQAKNYEKIGNFKLAYQAQQNHAQYKDSLNSKSNKELENTILAKYSVEKAENEVKITKMDKEVSELNAQKQKRLKYFGFLLLGLSLISIVIIISRHRKFLAERDKTRLLEKESAQAVIDKSRRVLEGQSELILNKNRLIDELRSNLTTLFNDVSVDMTGMNSFLDSKILTKDDWNKFKVSFTVVYPTFIQRASEVYPNLTASELRLLCLQKLGMNKQETADMLGVLPDSVKRTTNRFIQKFEIDPSLSLQEVVEGIE